MMTGGTVWAALRGRRWLFTGWFWYLGTLLPVIGLVQVGTQVMADRFLYLPQTGLWIAVAWTATAWSASRPTRQIVLAVAATAVVASFTVAAWRQTSYWRDSEALWNHTLDCDWQNPLAHYNLGLALQKKNLNDLAMEHYLQAIHGRADYALAYNNLGRLLDEKGLSGQALDCFAQAVALDTSLPEAEANFGNALRKKGDFAGADEHLKRAIALRSECADYRADLAMVRHQQGADAEAADLCREALGINSRTFDAHILLGIIASRNGKLSEAAEHFHNAVIADPRMPEAYFNLGSTLVQLGRPKDALPLLRTGLTLQPRDTYALEMTARLLATDPDPAVRNGSEAVELAVRAARLTGGRDPLVLSTLAAAYAENGQFENAVRAETAARDMVEKTGQSKLVAEIQRQLDLFRAGKAFHGGKW